MKKWLLVAVALAVTAGTVTAATVSLPDLAADQPVQHTPGAGGGPPAPGQPVSSDENGGSGGTDPAPAGMRKELAPIDGVEIRSAESFPPQYFVRVQYGLPSGCARPGGYQVQQQGNQIAITVWVLQPADPATACTMIYGMGEYNVPLGSAFTPGQRATVSVNGVETALTP